MVCLDGKIRLRSNAYRWANIVLVEGYAGLRPKSRRPHKVCRVARETPNEAIQLRRSYGRNSKKISMYLHQEGKMVSESTVEREIRRRELNQPLKKKQRRHKYVQWKRDHSNSLWQMDWSWIEKRQQWLLAIIDDHSRFLVGARPYTEATTDNALELIDESK